MARPLGEGAQIRRPPDLCRRRVGRDDRSADVVGADEGDDAAFDDRDGVPAVPDVFADQGAGGLVVLGDAATFVVEDRVDGDRGGRGEGADRLAVRREPVAATKTL